MIWDWWCGAGSSAIKHYPYLIEIQGEQYQMIWQHVQERISMTQGWKSNEKVDNQTHMRMPMPGGENFHHSDPNSMQALGWDRGIVRTVKCSKTILWYHPSDADYRVGENKRT